MKKIFTAGEKRKMENATAIFDNMSRTYDKAIKRFDPKKVKEYFVAKGYKIEYS